MESTCITIRHGENKQFYANTDCRLIVFLNFLKDKLELPRKELIDLCDESGNLMLLFLCKNQMENTKHLVPGRCTFIVCRIAKEENESLYNIIVPVIDNPGPDLLDLLQMNLGKAQQDQQQCQPLVQKEKQVKGRPKKGELEPQPKPTKGKSKADKR